MSNRIRFLVLLVATGLVAAACSSSAASPSPSVSAAAPSESASAAPSGSASMSAAPSESASSSASVMPSESGSASASPLTGSALIAAIPTQVGGKTLTVKTAKPSDLPLLTGDPGKAALTDLLTRLKISDSTVQAALGVAADKSITIGALSVPGADPTLLSLFFVSSAQGGSPVAITPTTISGKNVNLFGPPGKAGQVYVYATGSTVFILVTADQALATDALGKLP